MWGGVMSCAASDATVLPDRPVVVAVVDGVVVVVVRAFAHINIDVRRDDDGDGEYLGMSHTYAHNALANRLALLASPLAWAREHAHVCMCSVA